MKIIYGRIGHETNTLSHEKSDFERWSRPGWLVGEDITTHNEGKACYVSGMIAAAREENVDLIPTVWIWDAGPLLLRKTYDDVLDQFLDVLEKNKTEIDGICLAIHGAGCAEGIDCIETYTLKKVREIVGEEMPVAITLDLHANLTKGTVDLAQGVFGIKEYPHTDTYEAGYLAMKSLVGYISGKHGLYSSVTELPILVPLAIGFTNEEPMKSIKEYILEYVDKNDLLDASFMQGFPYSNREHAGTAVIAVSKRSQKEADDASRNIAKYIWENRDMLNQYKPLSAKEAMDAAIDILEQNPQGYVVINETSDNPGGGTTCDGVHLLNEMLKRNIPGSAMGYIADYAMTEKAFAAGIGGKISGFLGAENDKVYGEAIEIKDAIVCTLSDGKIVYNNPMVWHQLSDFGRAARIRVGNVDIVITEKVNQQTYDNTIFTMVGIDLEQSRILGVKSAIHFHAYFDSRSIGYVTADTPGITSSNLNLLNLDKVRRPIFPLDKEMNLNL